MDITQTQEYLDLRAVGATHEEAVVQIAIWNS